MTSPASRPATASPRSTAPPPSRCPPGAARCGGCPAAGTALSTTPSTWPPSPRSDGHTAPGAATTTARSPKARHRRKRCAPSSAASATPSGPPWSPTPDTPRLHSAQRSGLGRATGERLCRQRGRLTPRYAGSSAKPLPNPTEGYDHQDQVATHDAQNASEDPKNYLTNKEDSIGTRPCWRPRRASPRPLGS